MIWNIDTLLKKSTKDNTLFCKKDPYKCFFQVTLDGLVVVLMFSFITYVTEKQLPRIENIATFLAMWIPLLFVMKQLDMESSEQFARVALWSLATKVFAVLLTV